MWNHVGLLKESDGPKDRESLIQQFTKEKMREYDGAVFFRIARSDKERRITFQQAAKALGYSARDGRTMCAAFNPQVLAEQTRRDVLFVDPAMQEFLGEYLDACPAGMRHLLIYCRRGNGPSPYMSAFMDFWLEHGVDIWDLNDL
ncbi:MAG: hypothetical protein HFG18_10780 [Oscillospiraceae bacterium]|nr:hypothetical protein [Oscillospiraceae bacterium]RKJ33247.1 hypothetical protein D7X25_34245 [bacterium 1XD42-8]RKJ62097.1 hypothetical protein D7Y09_14610 [bacterium 1XD42-1]